MDVRRKGRGSLITDKYQAKGSRTVLSQVMFPNSSLVFYSFLICKAFSSCLIKFAAAEHNSYSSPFHNGNGEEDIAINFIIQLSLIALCSCLSLKALLSVF